MTEVICQSEAYRLFFQLSACSALQHVLAVCSPNLLGRHFVLLAVVVVYNKILAFAKVVVSCQTFVPSKLAVSNLSVRCRPYCSLSVQKG